MSQPAARDVPGPDTGDDEYGEQVENQGERPRSLGLGEPGHASPLRPAQRAPPARSAVRLRPRAVRRLLGAPGRQGDPVLRDACGRREREEDHDARGPPGSLGEGARHDGGLAGAAPAPAGVDRRAGAALRLLPERHDHPGGGSAHDHEASDRHADQDRAERPPVPLRDVPADPDGDQAGRIGDGEGRRMMTGFLHERDFSRKSFLKGGGALIVGFSVAGAALGGRASGAADPHPFTSFGPADSSLIDSWVVINADNTASVKLGKVELGQGSMTGLLVVAAEELSMEMSNMRAITNDTDLTPNQGTTAGSSSISSGGKQTRAAAAAAYQALLGLASTQLGVPASSLSVDKGVVSGGGKQVTYGQLLGGKLFNVKMGSQNNLAPTQPPAPSVAQGVASTGSGSSQGLAAAEVLPTPPSVPSPGQGLSPGAPGTKPVSQYKLVGVEPGPPRVDIPDKITGRYTYVQNVRVPGMLHGRIVRPRGQGAYGDGTNPQVLSVDAKSISHIPGAQVVQRKNSSASSRPGSTTRSRLPRR